MAFTHQRITKNAFSVLLCLCVAPACTGTIGGSSPTGSNTGSGSPGQNGSNGATPNGATTPGNPGTTTNTDAASCTPDAANPVTFRVITRLNRAEYDNTARDLLGDTTHAALNTLPADFGDGAFDNNADALTIDPALLDTYTTLAETLAQNAMAAGSPGRALVLTCSTTDDACAQKITTDFAARAWRRPLVAGEAASLFALYTATKAQGYTFDQGIQIMVEGALMSPNFLYRPELDATLDSPTSHAVTPYELATRLSYFIWSTMPDAALTASAASGELATPTGVQTQLERMWASPNAEAMFSRFPGQWLHTLDISVAKVPAPDVFPAFTAGLKAAMEGETAHYMREFMTGDVNFMSFINAKFTYLNATLATFYGVSGQFGTDFTRVDLTGNTQRGGILTQGSFLTLASPPERTSPVMRGQWVLARLLNKAPPPPPDNIPTLASEATTAPQTMRQKMVAHRSNVSCSSCHALMDPIGFGLENYDGIGQWRTTDNGIAVDSSGMLDNGKAFSGALDLETQLSTDARVPRALVQYLVSYALGREIADQGADQCMIDSLTSAFQSQDNGRMKALVKRVANLSAMSMRRGAM